MTLEKIISLPIADLQSQLLLFNISTLNILNYYLDNIKKSKDLNIFIEIYEEEAINKAIELDNKIKNKQQLGKLFGVIVSIKDVFCYENHIVSAASNMLKNYVSPYSATCIKKLLEEDAIIIGRVNCDEFAMGASNENSIYGPTKNPTNPIKVPGGSSGASAASIAANLCKISLGSDTGGSVRQPADFCGVIGLKPTYGKISRHGLIAYASSLDSVGILGSDLNDVQLVLNNICGKDEYDSTCLETINNLSPKKEKFKIAYFNQILEYKYIEKEIKQNFINVIDKLKKNNFVNQINFPFLEYLVPTYYIISCAEASSNLSRYDGIRYGEIVKKENITLNQYYKLNRTNGFGKEVKRRIMLGNFVLSSGYFDEYYGKAQKIRNELINQINKIFDEYDAIIIPNSPCLPWNIGENNNTTPDEVYLADIFSVIANLVSCPAISIPITKHSSGMPIGLQLICNKFNEDKLISIAKECLK